MYRRIGSVRVSLRACIIVDLSSPSNRPVVFSVLRFACALCGLRFAVCGFGFGLRFSVLRVSVSVSVCGFGFGFGRQLVEQSGEAGERRAVNNGRG